MDIWCTKHILMHRLNKKIDIYVFDGKTQLASLYVTASTLHILGFKPETGNKRLEVHVFFVLAGKIKTDLLKKV